jgi:MSHA biogenesis protein MshQ
VESLKTVMNATRTTLSDVLWRWQRGIARALLLGLALLSSQAAEAQIVFRNAASASARAPEFRAAASSGSSIAFIGAGAQIVTTTGASIIPVIPTGTAANDFAVLIIAGRPSDASEPAAPAGWTLRSSIINTGPTPDLKIMTFYRVLAGGDANPTVSLPAGWQDTSGTAEGMSGQIAVWRGVNTVTPFDVADVTGTSVAAATWTPPTIATVTNWARVVSAVATSDDNSLDNSAAQGFTLRMSGGAYDTTTGSDHAMGLADRLQATAGAPTMPTWRQNTAGANDLWASITFALRPVTTAIGIDKPAGTIQNDVMIASFGFRTNQPGLSSDIGITPPTGWTLVRRMDNPASSDNGLAVYRKVAGASEPGGYSWGLSCTATCATYGFQAAAGGIVSFSNVDTTTPVDLPTSEGGVNTAAGAQTTPSGRSTTVANAMLVASHSYATAGPWSPLPGGMNEAVDVLSGNLSTEINWLRQEAAGPVAQYQATPTPDDDSGNAHILALRPATPPLTINKPTGTVANDVMIASIGVQPSTTTITPPAGWTLVRRMDNATGNTNSLAIYSKVAGGAEPGSYMWTLSGFTHAVGGIQSFSGVDTASPIDTPTGEGGQTTVSGTSHSTPNVTTTVANTMLVTSHTFASSRTWTPPAGPPAMNEAFDVASLPTSNASGQSMEGNWLAQAAIGATGIKTATVGGDADVGNAHILALKPPAGVPTPGSFNAFETSTAAGAITGQIYTKLVSTNFSLDVVAILSGAQHATFTDTVQVDLVTGAAGGLNCPGTPVTIAGTTQNVNLTNGRGTTGNFNDARAFPDVRVRVRYPVASPTVTSCSTDNFSMRPTAFTVTSTNATQTGSSGTPTIKTGVNFNLTAASVAGYNGTPGIDNTKVVGTPTAGTIGGSFSAAPVGTGTATGASFYYNEVGNFGLNADAVRDTAFTNVDQAPGDCVASSTSNTLSGGKYGCWVGSTAVAQTTGVSGFGRFIPDNFNVTYTTPPIFGTVCGTFTYVGTTFTYPTAVMTVTARNGTSNGLTNSPTVNYAGAYMKLSNAAATSLNQAPYDTQGGRYSRFDVLGGGLTPALDTTGLPATTADPAIGAFSGGSGTLTFNSSTGLAFTRSTTTPNAPFNADIALALNVIDTDSVVFAGNPAGFGTVTSGGGISFSSGKPMRFGRLAIRNANGSQLVPLPVPMETQYWNGSAFITNVADSCTTVTAANIGLGNYTGNLGAGETTPTVAGGAFSNGRKTLLMSAPGAANNGSVDIVVNLGTTTTIDSCLTWGTTPTPTGANLSHLRGQWCGATYTKDPTARATFGVFKGAEEVIFQRENF